MNSEIKKRLPKRRSLISRLRRLINKGGTPKPIRGLHPPLTDQDMRNRIMAPIWNYLENCGFKKTDEEWVWIRPRTAWIDDYVFVPLLTKSAPELYGVNLRVGVRSSPIGRLLSALGDSRYVKIRPLLCPLISEPYLPNQQLPSRWNFWNTAFDDEEMDDLLWHLERYGFSFMESFSTLNDLIEALDNYSSLFKHWPEVVAAILVLAGRYDEAQNYIKDSLSVGRGGADSIRILSKMDESLKNKQLQDIAIKVLSSESNAANQTQSNRESNGPARNSFRN